MADVNRDIVTQRLGVPVGGLVARGELRLAVDGDQLLAPGDKDRAVPELTFKGEVETVFAIEDDGGRDPVAAFADANDIVGIGADVLGLGALKGALYGLADVAHVLRLF